MAPKGNSKSKGKGIAKEQTAKGKGSKRAREEASGSKKSSSEGIDKLQLGLSTCKVQPTKFLDWKTMTQLGVKDEMERMFTTMGVNQYMHRVEFTHADETLQFIRSLDQLEGSDDGIQFRIHGKTYRLTGNEISGIYGFMFSPMRASDLAYQGGMQEVWQRVASDSYRMGKSKSSTIRNPVIKLLQRALGFAFFGRFEVGQVTLDEWRLICFALRPLTLDWRPEVSAIPSISPTALFVENLFRAKETASMKKPDGWHLCIGGVLTPMFRHCGVQLSDPIRPVPLIDAGHLYNCRFLSPANRRAYLYPFTWAGQHMELELPQTDRDLISLSIPRNALFQHTPADLHPPRLEIEAGPSEPPSEPQTQSSARFDQPLHNLPQSPFEKEVAKRFGFLKRWCKWQDRSMKKMASHISQLKAKYSCRGDTTGETSGAHAPDSPTPSLDLSPPPQSDDESDTA